MSDTDKLISDVLENLRDIHTGLDKNIEYLIESVGYDEEDFADIKTTVGKIYKLNINLQDLLVAVLSKEYDSQKTRNDLINLGLIDTLKQQNGRKTMLEWFIKEKLDNSKD
jgi:hypothetical protein